jgi:glycosyltransferase involved in cell wall biosynthesis
MAAAGDRLRVTVVVDSNTYGGAEAYVDTLFRHLGDRVDFTLLASTSVSERLMATVTDRVAVVRVPPVERKTQPYRALRLLRALRASRPDVVHVNANGPANNRWAIGAAVALRVPVVLTVHLGGPLGSRLQRHLLRRTYHRLHATIAVSEAIRRQLIDDLGIPPERLTLVANGVDLPTEMPVRRPDHAPVVGTLSRLTAQKGIDVLLDAVARLDRRATPARVRVAGEGSQLEALQAAARDLPVEFVGDVADVSGYLASIDVFCLPSREEGLPFALLEAMASGLPCVASNVGDVGRALDGVGVLAPPGDAEALAAALEPLLLDAGERERLGRLARERVAERFAATSMADAVLRCYRAAAGG